MSPSFKSQRNAVGTVSRLRRSVQHCCMRHLSFVAGACEFSSILRGVATALQDVAIGHVWDADYCFDAHSRRTAHRLNEESNEFGVKLIRGTTLKFAKCVFGSTCLLVGTFGSNGIVGVSNRNQARAIRNY